MDSSLMDGQQANKITTKDIALIAMFSCILFIQEELLTFIPNVQLTIFLLVLYSKKFGFLRTVFILAIHVVLDNLVMGSFNLFYTPFMFLGWLFIPCIVCTLFKKSESVLGLSIVAAISGFIYSWAFMIPNYIFYKIPPLYYLASDIVFEIILSVCGFLTVFILYKPCSRVFEKFKISIK